MLGRRNARESKTNRAQSGYQRAVSIANRSVSFANPSNLLVAARACAAPIAALTASSFACWAIACELSTPFHSQHDFSMLAKVIAKIIAFEA